MATYDPNVDYSDLIAQEAAKGVNANKQLLAQYESLRNQKITDQNLPYSQTNIYTNDAVNSSSGTGVSGSTSGGYYTATDQSEYINQLYDAARQQAEAALKGAYDQQVLAFDHAEAELPEQYRTARNQTSADAAVARQNLNEQLAASGLNTGASGQARLAMNIAEQGNIATLYRQQQAALDDITLQRNQAQAEYQSAIAEAIANNEMQKAQALYQEAARVDSSYQSYLDDALKQAQLNMYNAQIAAMQAEQAAAATSTSVSSTGGTGYTPTVDSGTSGSPASGTTSKTPQSALDVGTQLQQLMSSGASDAEINGFLANAEALGLINTAQRMQYSRYAGLNGYSGTSATPDAISSYAKSLQSQLSTIPGLTEANKVGIIKDALNNNKITSVEADYLLYYLGY